MNMPVVQQPASPALPAHLQDFGMALSIGASAMGGIQIGQSHPRISIRQNRFRLLGDQGQEELVNALHLNVIVVGANDHVSKLYYSQAFNPADPEPPAPDCYSDNGTAPSDRAIHPQALACSGCPWAAWGSKVTPSGTKVKACSDSKKLAVILADNPTGPVYELRVPAASMENLKSVADTFEKRREPLPSIVLQLTFDANATYPKLLFTPVSYITPEQKQAVLEVLNGEEVAEAVGKNDKARDPNQPLIAQQAPAQQVQVPQPAAPMPQQQVFQQPVAPQPVFQQPPASQPVMQPQPQFQQPTAAAAPPAPMAVPMGAGAGVGGAAPAPRKRRTRAQIAAEAAAGMAGHPEAMPQPAMNYQVPPGVPETAAPHPVQPQFVAAQPVQGGQPVIQGQMPEKPSMPIQPQPQQVFTAPVQQPGQNMMPQQPVQQAATPNMPPMPDFLRRDVPNAQPAAASVPLQPQPTDAALDGILGNAMVR